jgi:hypothetical protein
MSTEINAESPDGAADDTPKVYTHEDEDREQDVPNDDDNLSDIKEDLVDESNNGRPGSAGEKSDGDDKTEKKPLSLYPAELTAGLFGGANLFNGAALASMLSTHTAYPG